MLNCPFSYSLHLRYADYSNLVDSLKQCARNSNYAANNNSTNNNNQLIVIPAVPLSNSQHSLTKGGNATNNKRNVRHPPGISTTSSGNLSPTSSFITSFSSSFTLPYSHSLTSSPDLIKSTSTQRYLPPSSLDPSQISILRSLAPPPSLHYDVILLTAWDYFYSLFWKAETIQGWSFFNVELDYRRMGFGYRDQYHRLHHLSSPPSTTNSSMAHPSTPSSSTSSPPPPSSIPAPQSSQPNQHKAKQPQHPHQVHHSPPINKTPRIALSKVNHNYQLCVSYPSVLAVPNVPSTTASQYVYCFIFIICLYYFF